jgi:ankyrin repeat protein
MRIQIIALLLLQLFIKTALAQPGLPDILQKGTLPDKLSALEQAFAEPRLLKKSDAAGATALHYLASQPDTATQLSLPNIWLQLCLQYGADPNEQDKAGNTPLHKAVIARNTYAATLLYLYNADPEIENNAGETALQLASAEPALLALLSQRASVRSATIQTSINLLAGNYPQGQRRIYWNRSFLVLGEIAIKNALQGKLQAFRMQNEDSTPIDATMLKNAMAIPASSDQSSDWPDEEPEGYFGAYDFHILQISQQLRREGDKLSTALNWLHFYRPDADSLHYLVSFKAEDLRALPELRQRVWLHPEVLSFGQVWLSDYYLQEEYRKILFEAIAEGKLAATDAYGKALSSVSMEQMKRSDPQRYDWQMALTDSCTNDTPPRFSTQFLYFYQTDVQYPEQAPQLVCRIRTADALRLLPQHLYRSTNNQWYALMDALGNRFFIPDYAGQNPLINAWLSRHAGNRFALEVPRLSDQSHLQSTITESTDLRNQTLPAGRKHLWLVLLDAALKGRIQGFSEQPEGIQLLNSKELAQKLDELSQLMPENKNRKRPYPLRKLSHWLYDTELVSEMQTDPQGQWRTHQPRFIRLAIPSVLSDKGLSVPIVSFTIAEVAPLLRKVNYKNGQKRQTLLQAIEQRAWSLQMQDYSHWTISALQH